MVKPEGVIWIVTARCVLSCVHCYAATYLGEEELGVEEAKGIVKGFAELGATYLHLTGGDPVAVRARDYLELARFAKDLGLEVTMFTSCVRIPKEFLEEGPRVVDALYTSLDGDSRELYEAIRGSGSWSRFLDGYRRARERFSYIHVNVTVSRLNAVRVAQVIRFAIEKLEPSSISLIPAMNCGRARLSGVHVDRETFVKALRSVSEVAQELGIVVDCWCTPFAHLVGKGLRPSTCRGRWVVDLSPSAKLLLCDVTGVAVSDARAQGVEEAWRRYVSSDVVRRALSIPQACASCRYLGSCGGGCFARSFLDYGELDRGDPLCPFSAQPSSNRS
ncbi:MAG: radical SAM protein [Crenarchaeota archaeon]|nr:radical SAM protein [Thermoproteota archaeon]